MHRSVVAVVVGRNDDVAIHDLVSVTAYFAFVNRIADGLGVALEDRWRDDSS